MPLLLAGAVGCVATRADLRTIDGKVAYLEDRLSKTEDLMTELTGSARRDVLQSRREMQEAIRAQQRRTAQLLVSLQAVEAELAQLSGRVAALEHARDQAPQDAEPARPATTPAVETWSSDKELYEAARAAFDAGDLSRAAALFERLPERFGDSPLVANASFWLGEIAWQQGDYLKAIERYLDVVENHADHPKAPAAWLKLGMSLEKLGETDQAIRTYEDLVQQFPDSEQARVARTRLDKLRKK